MRMNTDEPSDAKLDNKKAYPASIELASKLAILMSRNVIPDFIQEILDDNKILDAQLMDDFEKESIEPCKYCGKHHPANLPDFYTKEQYRRLLVSIGLKKVLDNIGI